MRLSQIKIAGFKSFVDPSKIVFPADITSIVGPNGCGKSNVIDAVRWVMGESSARNLRGDSMEDVIFSGSSERKPVGQASVELVFDNSDGRIKGEYAKYNEISVKRVATRAGQSKYFLNNTRCRRRDIADIFLGTGLGPRSYSIIEQGMVSRVIDAKPDELRVYLEEAAGISKYKERRRETETRIRHTRENLDRLNDLIEEIDKQLARLARQSKTAAKYKRLKQDLRRLEGESLLLQQTSFDREIEVQKRQLAGLETGMEERTAGLRQTEREIEQNREQLAEVTEKHGRIQGQFYQLGSDISAKEQAIENQKNMRQHNQQELASLQQSLQESIAILCGDREQLQQLQQQLEVIQPKLETGQADLVQQQAVLAESEQQMHQWQEQWDQFRRAYHEVHESAQIENRGIEHIERQVSQTDQQRLRLQEELQRLDTTELVAEIDQLEDQVEGKSQEHAATIAQSQNRAEEIQQMREANERLFAQLDDQRNQQQTLRGRLSSLEALQQHVLAESSDEVKGWLERNRIDSRRRLADMLKVGGNCEKAVELVLSPFLGAYSAGSGATIPDRIIADHHIAIFDSHRVETAPATRDWPRLADLVTCDVDLSGLLGGIYLCRDADELRHKRPQLQPGESLVLPQGVWAGRNWIVQLGEEDQHVGTLERAQEIESIRARLSHLDQSLLDLKSRYDGDRQRLQHHEQQWNREQKTLAELQQQLSALRQQLSQRLSRAEHMQDRRQQVQKEIAELEERYAGHTSELESNSARRNDFLRQVSSMAEREAELQLHKTQRQQRLAESRAAVQQVQDQTYQLQIKYQALESEQRARRSNIERVERQNEQFDERITALQAAVDGADEPIETLHAELQALLQSRSETEKHLHDAQLAVSAKDARQRELEEQRARRQQQADEFRGQMENQRMQLQEASIRRNTVAEQLQKTGLDLETLQQELDPEAELEAWNQQIESMSQRIDRLGPINLAAIEEHAEQAERKQYLDAQNQDLISALETLENAIRKIDKETRERFKNTFEQINSRLGERFPLLFGGGEAHLEMTENDLLNTGIQIMARPPGKRITNLQLLSGGEKALTAVALIFAIFELNPSPFCMLDEVDAPLDDANVGRFCSMVQEMSARVQFIIITHNKITMEMSHSLNGVTMHEPGVSRLVSVDVGEAVALAEAR